MSPLPTSSSLHRFSAVFALLLTCGSAAAQTRAPSPGPAWPFSGQPTPSAKPAAAPAPALTPAQFSALEAERAKLLEGVASAPRLGAPGPVAIYGMLAFPLLTTRDGRSEVAVGAAAQAGKGRAVIFGHTGYIDSSTDADLSRLLLNAVKWCGQKAKPRVGLKGSKLESAFEKEGLTTSNLAGALDKKALQGCDVVVVNLNRLTDESEGAALKEYLEGGGGVIAAMTGWAFPQLNGGTTLYGSGVANRALAGAGLAWTEDSLAQGGSALDARKEAAPLLNAFSAISALRAGPPPAAKSLLATPAPVAKPPTDDEVLQATKSIQLALSAMPAASRPALQQLLAGLFAGGGKPAVPTPEAPLTARDGEARARAGLEAQLMKFLPASAVQAHPAAEKFPGRPSAPAKPVTKNISIDPKIPAWHSTGLYADAGAPISVKLPLECVNQGYEVRIGCHRDNLEKLEEWKRLPEVTIELPLSTAETLVSSSFGGLIYLVVPDKAKQERPFAVAISGGVEAPYFVLGETTDQQWQQLRQRPAPWGELACKGVILTAPTAVLRGVNNPTELMQYWQRVVDAEDELSNVTAERRRPERIVPDVQISAGFMHSGYPIMIHLPQAEEMVTYNSRKWPGWGFYHELGHNHQKPEWTFDGTGEVTCNLFSLYIFEAVLGKDKTIGHPAVLPQTQEENYARHKKAGAPFSGWKSDPFLALTSYIQLLDAFGFDTLKQVLRSYQSSEFGPLPKSDDEKRDQWMIRYAKTCGKNLGPFFDAWGIPVSASAKAEIAKLPTWMPKGM